MAVQHYRAKFEKSGHTLSNIILKLVVLTKGNIISLVILDDIAGRGNLPVAEIWRIECTYHD
ncbi:MAG: hypothetical protein ACYSW3_02195 [Planctomycetota bacterium]|jgi:hypothetical protein